MRKLCALLALLALVGVWPEPTRAQDNPMALTVELGDVSGTKLPFIVAAEAGIYTRNGLTVTQFITPAAAEAARQEGLSVPPEMIKSGVVGDINIGGGSPTMTRMTTIASAPQRIILATNDVSAEFHLYARAGITKLADLKGRRISFGSQGALDHLILNIIARRMHWNPSHDWSLLSGVYGPSLAAKYHIDAFVGDPSSGFEALKYGYHDIYDCKSLHATILGSGVNAMKDWLPTHRAAAAAFIKSTIEAIALIKNNKQTAFDAMAKWYGLTDPAKAQAFYALTPDMLSKPYPSAAGLALVRSIYNWREFTHHPVSYFLDPSFVAALDRSGFIAGLYNGSGSN